MLLTNKTCDAIFGGSVTVAFRRWQKPTVKAGGHLRTVRGEVEIVSVDIVDPELISDADAQAAGFADADALRHDLFRERTGSVRGRTAKPTENSLIYRVGVAPGGEDPRIALRNAENLDVIECQLIAESWQPRTGEQTMARGLIGRLD